MSGAVETVRNVFFFYEIFRRFFTIFFQIEFLGYTSLMCYIFFLTLGTVGFAASLKDRDFKILKKKNNFFYIFV